MKIKIGDFFRTCAKALAYRISKSICKFVRFTQKSLATCYQAINKKQDKNDQKVFRDINFIQRNAKFYVRSKKRTNILRVRNPRNTAVMFTSLTTFHDQKIVQLYCV